MKTQITREVDMFPIVREWLVGRGFEARAELAVRSAPVDVVAFDESTIIACEMKLSWKWSLNSKLNYDCAYWADEVWFCCADKPQSKTLAMLSDSAIGVFSCRRGVIQHAHPRPARIMPRLRERALDKLRRAPTDLIGGAPTTKGQGPRQLCEQRIREYMRQHPQAKSREVFESVANHYATFSSFSGVFGAFVRSIRRGEVAP